MKHIITILINNPLTTMAANNRGAGRILPHQRNANFDGVVLGEDIGIAAGHTLATHDVELHTITIATKRKHSNKNPPICSRWCTELNFGRT